MAEDKFRSKEVATSGSKTTGTSQVLTFLAPSRRNARRAHAELNWDREGARLLELVQALA